MRKCYRLAVYTAVLALCCSSVYCITLTFDDIPSGTVLVESSLYHESYRLSSDPFFMVADHTASPWGQPHSGSNVLIWPGSDVGIPHAGITFGYVTAAGGEFDEIRSVGAYFSTQAGVVVRMTAYHFTLPDVLTAVQSVIIGAAGESWNNRYVEIGLPGSTFNVLRFEGVNSPQELLAWCADDMTIVPVPEPASLLALSAGLLAILARRRF